MKFATGFDTTSGRIAPVQKIEATIRQSMVRDRIETNTEGVLTENNITPCFITAANDSEDQIPFFYHSILVKDREKQYLFSDLRFYLRKDGAETKDRIRNLSEYNFAKGKAILNLLWLNPSRMGMIRNTLQYAGIVYSNWIAEIISKAYALNAEDKTRINILASYFYQSLFIEGDNITESDITAMATHTMRAAGTSGNTVFSVFDKVKQMNNIAEFCETLKEVVDNTRLANFSVTVLLELIKASWFSTNSSFLLSAALEHPPTWIAIVFAAMSDRSYKNTTLSKICETKARIGNAHEFAHNYFDMIQEMEQK